MKHTVGAVRIEICYLKGEVEFRVSDEGAGIRKRKIKRLFLIAKCVCQEQIHMAWEIGLHSVRESLNWINSRCHVESPYLRNVNIHNGKESGENVRFIFLVHYDRSRVYKEGKRKIERIRIMLPIQNGRYNLSLRRG